MSEIECPKCGRMLPATGHITDHIERYGSCPRCYDSSDSDRLGSEKSLYGYSDNDDNSDNEQNEMSDMVRCMECGQAYEPDSEDAEAVNEHGMCIKCGNFDED